MINQWEDTCQSLIFQFSIFFLIIVNIKNNLELHCGKKRRTLNGYFKYLKKCAQQMLSLRGNSSKNIFFAYLYFF